MDPVAFDRMLRRLTQSASRRRAIGSTLASVLGLTMLADGDAKPESKSRSRREARPTALAKKPASCKRPKKKCGKKCINVKRDRKNCGRCKRKCAPGVPCRNGRCTPARPNPGPGCALTLGPADNLQQAINAAAPNSTLCLQPGTYQVFGGIEITKNLTLRGTSAETTILQGDGSNSVVRADVPAASPISLHVEGVTITGGGQNSNTSGGGGIYANACNLTVIDCVIDSNTSSLGGGIFIGPDAEVVLLVRGSTISNNVANHPILPEFTTGGGIAGWDRVSITIEDSQILGNTSTGVGGGVFLRDSHVGSDVAHHTLTMTRCTVSGNTARAGAGIDADRVTTILANCTITDNHATTIGGGMLVQPDFGDMRAFPTTLTNVTITENTADVGAGIYYFGDELGNKLSLIDSDITGNDAATEGGGIYTDETRAVVELENSSISGNAPDNCAGEASVTGCTN